jgi:putative redox protein
MECKVKWLEEGMTFIATTGTGHILAMDGAIEAGGNNLAPRPMELLLAGAAGCSSFDVVMILKKARQNILGCEVAVKSKRAEVEPKVFTQINFHFYVKGKNLDATKVENAIKLSHEKYCSASIMLGKTAELNFTFDIIEV